MIYYVHWTLSNGSHERIRWAGVIPQTGIFYKVSVDPDLVWVQRVPQRYSLIHFLLVTNLSPPSFPQSGRIRARLHSSLLTFLDLLAVWMRWMLWGSGRDLHPPSDPRHPFVHSASIQPRPSFNPRPEARRATGSTQKCCLFGVQS